ncbi:MAG: sigma-70 family RNA polymerase sigma factor [Candidatus Dormibacteraeota bacterium]|nr:sigma-70 family RNA polymerase sigma factor [Candidatus Dormibacteraeota bacterium]
MESELRWAALTDVVEAARARSPEAWAELVERFQDLAVATGLGLSGDVDAARDAAQEAFALAYGRLHQLHDPEAFPAWLMRLVRTACSRERRETGPRTIALADHGVADTDQPDPAGIVVLRAEQERVRVAIEQLPEGERVVIALHYLAGLPYPEVATFLGIGTSAAKKRAFTARKRLKELLPMTKDKLVRSRPSRTPRFRDTVLLFAAIRRRDRQAVGRLLRDDPSLLDAEEDWTVEEALEAHLPFANRATPLVRAADTGDADLVRVVLEAGARPSDPCGCAGGETALWVGVVTGSAPVVELLLQAGADPNVPAFHGATPLHVAYQRGRPDLVELLVAAGADTRATDSGGRTPKQWMETTGSRISAPAPGPLHPLAEHLMTGIRAIDLLAPPTRGSLQRWSPAHRAGHLVVLTQLARTLAPRSTWWIGFEQDLIAAADVEHALLEMGVPGRTRLIPPDLDGAAARARFEDAIREVTKPDGEPRLVICFEAPGHTHDVAAALPRLAASPEVVLTAVIEPSTAEPAPSAAPPEGYHSRVVFDPLRPTRMLLPAIDPRYSSATEYPSERHARLAMQTRALLSGYQRDDPELRLPDPGRLPDPKGAAAAQRLIRYLAQPFQVAEPFTSRRGEATEHEELLDTVERLLAG